MKDRLEYNSENQLFINNLTKIYLIACWARYGVREYPFSGEFEKLDNGKLMPLVWDFTDHNGTYEEWVLRPIDEVTTGFILDWSFNKNVAEDIAEKYNEVYENKKNVNYHPPIDKQGALRGWICPNCGSANAPFQSFCSHCIPPKKIEVTY